MLEVRVVSKNGTVQVAVPVSSKYAAKTQARRLADKYGDDYIVTIEQMEQMTNGKTETKAN